MIKDSKGKITWTPGITAASVGRLSMQNDKNLVLYDAAGRALWSANIPRAGVVGQERCVLGDDGELTVSNWGGLLWSAGSKQGPGILSSGQSLKPGDSLSSPNRCATMAMNAQGVVTVTAEAGEWMTAIPLAKPGALTMQRDGNLVLTDADGRLVLATETTGHSGLADNGLWLELADNGTFVIRDPDQVRWSSGELAPNRLGPLQGLAVGNALTFERSRLQVQAEGGVVVINAAGQTVWSANVYRNDVAALSVKEGRLRLLDKAGNVLWQLAGSGEVLFKGTYLTFGRTVQVFDSSLYEGDILRYGQSLRSPSNQRELAFTDKGALVVRQPGAAESEEVAPATNTQDCWFIVNGAHVQVQYGLPQSPHTVWTSPGGEGVTEPCRLSLADSGRLRLETIGATPKLVWQRNPATVASPANLQPGDQMTSPNGVYTLSFLPDGKLTLTKGVDKSVVWSGGATGGTVLRLQDDGNVVVYDKAGKAVWASNSFQYGVTATFRLAVTDAGKLTYTNIANGKVVWTV